MRAGPVGVLGRAQRTRILATARDGAPVKASCRSNEDGSRGVGWAAGPVAGRPDLAYAAVMEGKSTPPGLIMADKLDAAFKSAGL